MLIVEAMIVMEQSGWPGNIGDSCAETNRAIILGVPGLQSDKFITPAGFVRHPNVPPSWAEPDASNDQLLPLLLVRPMLNPGFPYIRGTRTLLSLGSWLIVKKQWMLLNLINIVQSYLLPGPEKDESADYLNHAIIYVALKNMGRWATLRNPELVLAKIESYYKPEPNPWILDYYRAALRR